MRRVLGSRKLVGVLLLSSLFLAVNWLLYIYATVNKRITEASLGYYVLPLVNAAFATVFLAFGVPGIPRGAFIMLTPLFAVIGLPAEGIGILIAVDALPDLFATMLNVTGDLAATAIVARGESSPTLSS